MLDMTTKDIFVVRFVDVAGTAADWRLCMRTHEKYNIIQQHNQTNNSKHSPFVRCRYVGGEWGGGIKLLMKNTQNPFMMLMS